MRSACLWCLAFATTAAVVCSVSGFARDSSQQTVGATVSETVAEARARAHILHEAFHGALQVMHRDLFDEDNARVLPSASLEDVFKEMERSHGIKLTWLAVNAKAMNIDHEPNNEFEKAAAKAIRSGKQLYESHDADRYRYAGTIRLASQCLKCHLPNRTSTDDRAAALVISMPLINADKRSTSTSAE